MGGCVDASTAYGVGGSSDSVECGTRLGLAANFFATKLSGARRHRGCSVWLISSTSLAVGFAVVAFHVGSVTPSGVTEPLGVRLFCEAGGMPGGGPSAVAWPVLSFAKWDDLAPPCAVRRR